MTLTEGVLEGTKQSATDELASIEADLKTAEGALDAIRASESDAATTLEEAISGVATVESSAAMAAKAVSEAEKQLLEAERESAAFLELRQEQQQRRACVAAVVEGPLRLLLDGGWDNG